MKLRLRQGRHPQAFTAFGVPFGLEVEDKLWPAIEPILPPGCSRCDSLAAKQRFGLSEVGEDMFTFTIGEAAWIEHAGLDVAVNALDQQLRLYIAEQAPGVIFVHAGVVARDGRAMVIPGESFSGKTTLVRALVEAGAEYYSDEYAVLDPDGQVHPYARRLSIRSEDGTPSREQHVSELGGTAAETSAELALVVLTRYKADGEWRPETKSMGDAVVALMANAVPAQARPRETLSALSRAVRSAQILESDRGEARAIAPRLLDALRANPTPESKTHGSRCVPASAS
jgi:hypothetical protein